MDVERIQKVNNLALDLVKQGLAPDREQAIAQAEKIYSGRNEDYDSIKDTLSLAEVKEKIKIKESTPELSQDQIKNILEQNTKFLVKKITQFQEQISTMEKEMQSLKSQLAYNKIPSAGQILTKEAVKQSESAVNNAAQSKGNGEKHPRMGNYSEEDVSVEKFFYAGKVK